MKRILCFSIFLLSGCDFLDDLTGFLEPRFNGKAYIVSLKNDKGFSERVRSKLQSFGIECLDLKSETLSPAEQHRKIWRQVADSNENQAMILEDNVYFEKDFRKKLQRYVQDLPQDWDIAFLVIGRENNKHGCFIDVGAIFRDIDEVEKHPYVAKIQKTNLAYGLYGYIINKRGAKKLLDLTKDRSIDISDLVYQKGGINTGYIKAYVSMFKLLEPKLTKSDIEEIERRFFLRNE
jgi:hypothetical protein